MKFDSVAVVCCGSGIFNAENGGRGCCWTTSHLYLGDGRGRSSGNNNGGKVVQYFILEV